MRLGLGCEATPCQAGHRELVHVRGRGLGEVSQIVLEEGRACLDDIAPLRLSSFVAQVREVDFCRPEVLFRYQPSPRAQTGIVRVGTEDAIHAGAGVDRSYVTPVC